MKRILVGMLVLALLTGAAWAENAAGELLGFELLQEMYRTGENAVISPDSLALALGMAAEGARGDTLDELLDALGVEGLEALGSVAEGIEAANAVFVRPDVILRDAYAQALDEKYAAEQFEIDGDAAERVNSWVNEKTGGLIDSLLDEPLPEETCLVLINAIAMDADWAMPFSPEKSCEEIFHAPGGDVSVEMMHKSAYYAYAERDGAQVICLPYAGSELCMWILMPEAGGMEEMLEKLAEEGHGYFTGDAERREVRLALPKLDVEDENSLTELMQRLGVKLPFGGNADFSGMSDVPMRIDEVFQKVRIQVDEAGTKAAAATMIAMSAMAMLSAQETVEMRVDRPFVFVIAGGERGSVCFAGVIENPME